MSRCVCSKGVTDLDRLCRDVHSFFEGAWCRNNCELIRLQGAQSRDGDGGRGKSKEVAPRSSVAGFYGCAEKQRVQAARGSSVEKQRGGRNLIVTAHERRVLHYELVCREEVLQGDRMA